jgi:hypothetical protein
LLTKRGKTVGWGAIDFCEQRKAKTGGEFLLTQRGKTGGKISVNFTVKQPLPVPKSGHHILSINPCSCFCQVTALPEQVAGGERRRNRE